MEKKFALQLQQSATTTSAKIDKLTNTMVPNRTNDAAPEIKSELLQNPTTTTLTPVFTNISIMLPVNKLLKNESSVDFEQNEEETNSSRPFPTISPSTEPTELKQSRFNLEKFESEIYNDTFNCSLKSTAFIDTTPESTDFVTLPINNSSIIDKIKVQTKLSKSNNLDKEANNTINKTFPVTNTTSTSLNQSENPLEHSNDTNDFKNKSFLLAPMPIANSNKDLYYFDALDNYEMEIDLDQQENELLATLTKENNFNDAISASLSASENMLNKSNNVLFCENNFIIIAVLAVSKIFAKILNLL
ncbi:hypothetical protein GVAV_000997 [Gurleya vavrai]